MKVNHFSQVLDSDYFVTVEVHFIKEQDNPRVDILGYI